MNMAAANPIVRILAPVDFSERSDAAVEYALLLCRRLGASLDLLHVWQPPRISEFVAPAAVSAWRELEKARQSMHDYLLHLDEGDVDVHGDLESGDPEATILRLADEYDLIVMGTRGRTGINHLLAGSLTERVLQHAPCPVLSVRVPNHEDAQHSLWSRIVKTMHAADPDAGKPTAPPRGAW